MKKLLLLALVMLGGVMSASADDPQTIYLRNNLNIDNINGWGGSNNVYKFAYQGKNESNPDEDVYTYDIDASNFSNDIYFRLWVSGWDYEFAPNCRYHNDGYTFSFANGQYENYDVKVHWDEYKNQGKPSDWGDKSKDRTFAISQSSIKAAKYKITLYCSGYNTSDNLAIKVEIVSMPATVSSLGYSTFSCDRALDLDNATGITAAYKASVNNGKVVLTKVTGKVAEGTGLLLAGTTGFIPVVTKQEGIDISSTNLLKASVTNTEVAASTTSLYHYFLAGIDAASLGFYNLESNATSSAGKAYLETTTELTYDPATSRVAWIFADNNATGINTIQNAQYDDVPYDLQGRVAKTAKAGLYIKNGKKVIVK